MTNLYLDNFRGFSRTVIPFSQVNFLVGENSTGKSSILALMNLLSSPDFWFSQSFNQTEHEFGGFRDILSATSSTDSHFSFGVSIERPNSRDKTDKPFSFLASYSEQDALPSLAFFARLHGCQLLAIRKCKKIWKYTTTDLPAQSGSTQPSDAFSILHAEHQKNAAGYRNVPKSIPTRSNVFPMIAMLDSMVATGKTNLHEYMFPVPILGHNLAWLAPIRTKPKRTYDVLGNRDASLHSTFYSRIVH
jgi:hypothetical protein